MLIGALQVDVRPGSARTVLEQRPRRTTVEPDIQRVDTSGQGLVSASGRYEISDGTLPPMVDALFVQDRDDMIQRLGV
jgi:hypothetical protein